MRETSKAARRLRAAVLVLLDPATGGIQELWREIATPVTRRELEHAADTVDRLASEPDPNDGQDAASCCATIRACGGSCSRPAWVTQGWWAILVGTDEVRDGDHQIRRGVGGAERR